MLIPRGGSTIRVPYTRASSLSAFTSSDYGLTKWRIRHIVKGLCDREDLAAMGAALPRLVNDPKVDRPVNRTLDVITEDALVEGQALQQAHYGTAVHGFTEPGPRGPVAARMQDDVASFWAAIKAESMEILATEQFVANDEVMSAGTFDHVIRHEGELYVADKKTGDLHGMEFAIQLAVYAYGDRYNLETDERMSMASVCKDKAIADDGIVMIGCKESRNINFIMGGIVPDNLDEK